MMLRSILTAICLLASVAVFSFFYSPSSPLPTNESRVALYSNQTRDDLRATLIQAIKNAQQSVLLIIFSLTDEAVISALRKKAESGIDVSLIMNGKNSHIAARKLGPKVKVHKRFLQGLMHQKILVVDHLDSFIGSANMTPQSLKMHGNLITAIRSQELACFIETYAKAIIAKNKQPPAESFSLNIDGQSIEFYCFPLCKTGPEKIIELINSAKKTIRIAMFTWTRHDVAKAVINAKLKGIDVQTALDHSSALGASAKVADMLFQQKIPVRLSQGPGLLHHKFLYIDNEILVNGSANWTLAAFTKNDDCFMILKNLSKQQQKTLDRLWDAITRSSVSMESLK